MLKSKDISQITEEDIKEFYIRALKLEPQMLINYLVKEIKAFDENAKLYFDTRFRQEEHFYGETYVTKVDQRY